MSENEKNYVGEINELKKKLSEYEKKMAEMTSLKHERNKLKKSLEEKGKDLKKESIRLLIKEDGHKVTVGKLKAEIEELKGENSEQYKAGYDKAIRQMVFFASGLKP
ncbi:hypothetical protein TSUD_109980 [Trifolium subterraneum]|uniref:Uncharacterized protein n=1 Tax=Trifolium subterraneum TaxID=3900 RepID=A0A2Z6LY99_TRISU|nr:hypothetical protein TSUD_109980 [Trifolium subterraneum]